LTGAGQQRGGISRHRNADLLTQYVEAVLVSQ